MKTGRKNFLRVCIFSLVTLIMLFGLNLFFQPIWYDWNNFYTINGFYEEPENTVETVILGPSVALTAITPMELYNEYGMSAYNLGTERQPVLASYYWLEEAYRLHSESLKTVVFDVSAVREDATSPFYHKVFDQMKWSEVKLRALYDYHNGDISKMINFSIPLLAYHNRWSSLKDSDIDKFTTDPDIGTRGYFYLGYIYADRSSYDKVPDKLTILDEDAKPGKLDKLSVEYLKKMAAFCKEKGLNLLLIRTSTNNWNSGYHNAIQPIADELGLTFLDFNFDPLYSEYGYIHPYDTKDGNHLNYYGATKFTKWIGKYLSENFEYTDVRNKPGFEHIEEQAVEYNARVIEHTQLASAESVAEYLEIAIKGNNTVMVAVKDEASIALSDKDRAAFAKLGLTKLAKLAYRDSYLAIIENGEIVHEEVKHRDDENKKPLTYKGTLNNGKGYTVTSGSNTHGNKASVKIGREEQLSSGRGINILVYNNTLKEVDDTATFDTFVTTKRERYGLHNMNLLLEEGAFEREYDPNSVEGLIIGYEERIKRLEEFTLLQEKIGKNNLFGFLLNYWTDPNNVIAISVYDQAATKLTTTDRKFFLKFGLPQLATISFNDSYVAYIDGGEVIAEVRGNSKRVYWSDIPGVYLSSGSTAAGKECKIELFGEQYGQNKRGINIAVYNKEIGSVIAKTNFNTYSNAITY